MPTTYVTFGQAHYHKIDDKVFDKDCVASIQCENAVDGREKAFTIFGNKFCVEYHEPSQETLESFKNYFPRGIIQLTVSE